MQPPSVRVSAAFHSAASVGDMRATGVCVSRAIRDQLRPYVSGEVPLPVIPNGVADVAVDFDPERYQRTSATVILWVGSDEPHKNPGELVEALSYLEQQQRRSVQVRFAGALSDGSRLALTKRASRLGLATSLVFLGHLSRAELMDEYKRATLFVSTSSVESSSLPPLEAMVNGTPLVLSGIEAHLEIAPEAPYYQVGKPFQLAQHISDLLGDSSLRRRVAETGLHQAGRRTWRSAAEAYREQFEAAIAKR